MLKCTYEAVKRYLEDNIDEALDIAYEINCEDGSIDWVETYDWDELVEMVTEAGSEAVDELIRAAVNGEIYGGRVRYNGYGNLESGEEEDLIKDCENYLTDIMHCFEDYVDNDGTVYSINVSDELQEVIDNSAWALVKVTNIVYDTDESERSSLSSLDDISELPKELELKALRVDENKVDEDELVDLISDETGWCILSYNYEVIE